MGFICQRKPWRILSSIELFYFFSLVSTLVKLVSFNVSSLETNFSQNIKIAPLPLIYLKCFFSNAFSRSRCTTVIPLITNTSEEFIKCRLDTYSMSFILYYVNFSICENK